LGAKVRKKVTSYELRVINFVFASYSGRIDDPDLLVQPIISGAPGRWWWRSKKAGL